MTTAGRSSGDERTEAAPGLAEALELVPVIVRDMDGTIRRWGAGPCALYGYDRGEAIGRRSHELLRTVFPTTLEAIGDELQTRGSWRGELRHRHKDGHEVVVASQWMLQPGLAGRPRTVVEVSNDITAWSEAACERQRLAAIVECSNDAIIGKSLDGTVLSWNPAAERMLGYSAAEIIGRKIFILAPPGPGSDMPGILARIRRGEQVNHYETRRRHKDGRIIDVSVTISPIRDASGAVIGASKIARDITERKRVEATLRESEARIADAAAERQAILDHLSEGVIVAGRQGTIRFINQAAQELHGVSQVGVGVEGYATTFGLFTEDGAPYPPAELPLARAVLNGETVANARWRIRRPDGTERLAIGTASPVRAADGTQLGAVLTVRDDTVRATAELSLRDSEQRFRMLLENLPQMMWVNRADGSAEYFNAAGRAYLGEAAARPGIHWTESIHPADRDHYLAIRARALAAEEPYGTEYRLRGPDGVHRWHSARIVPLRRDGRVNAWVGTASDIDDIRRMTELLEQRVEERTRKLEEANAELEAFSYSVAHDLQAPLRRMRGFSQALLEDHAHRLGASGRDFTGRIVAAADHMDRMIGDLLAYSRLSRAEIQAERIHTDEVLQDVLDQMRDAIAEAGGQVVVNGPLPPVMGQRTVLHQVLFNLIANAIKYVAPGTRPLVRILAEPAGVRVRLIVEDNGIGLDPEHAERVFKMFERLHEAGSPYSGMGIGLATVRKGVERMGGRAGVDSAPGQGSRFWVELPAGAE